MRHRAADLGAENLQGDVAAQARVASAIHLAHASAAKQTQDFGTRRVVYPTQGPSEDGCAGIIRALATPLPGAVCRLDSRFSAVSRNYGPRSCRVLRQAQVSGECDLRRGITTSPQIVDHALQIIEEAVLAHRIDMVVVPQTRLLNALVPAAVAQPVR